MPMHLLRIYDASNSGHLKNHMQRHVEIWMLSVLPLQLFRLYKLHLGPSLE